MEHDLFESLSQVRFQHGVDCLKDAKTLVDSCSYKGGPIEPIMLFSTECEQFWHWIILIKSTTAVLFLSFADDISKPLYFLWNFQESFLYWKAQGQTAITTTFLSFQRKKS